MTDKKTIGLTPAGERIMDQLMEQGCFKDMLDAAKFAMSIAIRDGAAPASIEGVNTIWNVGSFDSDGQIRQILPILFPEWETPYRAAESLIDQGLASLEHIVNAGQFDPVSQLSVPKAAV